MRGILLAGFLALWSSGANQVRAEDMPPPNAPPIESEPACDWSRADHGEWLCSGRFKLARGAGDPLRTGHCGTAFKAGTVIVTSLSLHMDTAQDPDFPFYLTGLDLNRESPEATVIGGTFRSEKAHPEDVYCKFSARIKVQ